MLKLRWRSGNGRVREKELCDGKRLITHGRAMAPRVNRKWRWILHPNNRDTRHLLLFNRCFLFSIRVLQLLFFLMNTNTFPKGLLEFRDPEFHNNFSSWLFAKPTFALYSKEIWQWRPREAGNTISNHLFEFLVIDFFKQSADLGELLRGRT